MEVKRKTKPGRTLAVLLSLLPATVAADPGLCEGCHGASGISSTPEIPTIAGVSQRALEDQLFSFLDGIRDDSAHRHNPNGPAVRLNESDIIALAEHYAQLTFVPAKQAYDPALAERGKVLHQQQCARCHSQGGSSAADDTGILAGQWMPYLEAQFTAYSSGHREGNLQQIRAMAKMAPSDRDALLHYYASQQ